MTPLPTVFRSDGFDFKQIDRQGDVACFEKTKAGFSFVGYKVVIVQKYDDYTIAGKLIKAHVAMPSSESWGKYGWTYPVKADAFKRMEGLAAAKDAPVPIQSPKEPLRGAAGDGRLL